MKLRLPALLLAIFLAGAAGWAQSASSVPITTQQLTIPLASPPRPVPSATVRVVGNSGNSIYYYWVVSDFLIGDSSPAGPFVAANAPNVLSAADYIAISPQPVSGAAGYDILRTTTPAPPTGACNCAVAIASSGATVSDQGAALQAYTVTPYNPAAADVTLTNLPTGAGANELSIAFGGAEQLSFSSSGEAGFTSVTAKSIGSVRYADQYCATRGVLNQSCISNAVAAIGSSQATLFIPSGSYAIGANLTIPSNVTLQFARGAIWTVAVPYVVQINGPLIAGDYQIFSTTLPTQTTGSMTSGSVTLTTTGLSAADVGSAVYVADTSATSVTIPVDDVLGMGYGNGTQAVFTYTAAHLPINANSVSVSDAVVRGADNGTGTIAAASPFTSGITGTVNYTTGAISVTFTTAPATGTIVSIEYEYTTKEPTVGTITSVSSSTSATLSFSAASTASNATVMFGGSYVKFGGGYVSSLNPMWWGAVGDGATDSTAALQSSMTACGESQLPLSVPSGTYITNATLDAGDPFTLGFYNTSTAEVGLACSIFGQPGGATFGQHNPVTFQAAAGFPSGAYMLQRENAASVDWENFYVNGNSTGANGIDAAWLWIPGTPSPATGNRLINVDIVNFGRIGAFLDNWNDAIIRDVNVAQATGNVPIGIQLEAGGGPVDLFFDRVYGGVVRVDAQNGGIIGGGLYDGLELIGQGRDNLTIEGTQIFANAATSVALFSTNTSSDGVDSLVCDACYVVANSGQTYIAGRFGKTIAFNGTGFTGTGSATFFGTISTAVANGPNFVFNGGDGGLPTVAPNLGSVIEHTPANTSATISSTPATFEDLTAPTTGYICLGSGTCNKTTNFALGVNATGDLIASGADTPVYVGHDSSNASYNVISLNGQASDIGAMGFFGGKSTDQNLYVVSPGNISWRPGGVTTNVLTVSTSGINIGGGQTIANSNDIALTTQLPLSGTTASIGGSALAAGACTTGTVVITGATTAMVASTSPAADPGAGFAWQAWVSAAGTVTVRVCNRTSASLTPTASAYNVRVVQ